MDEKCALKRSRGGGKRRQTCTPNMGARQYYAASWFAQQAGEKALKALFLEQRAQLPIRTHDLEHLASQLEGMGEIDSAIAALNPAFNMVRYPDAATRRAPVDEVSMEDSVEHLQAAERIVEWVRAQLTNQQ